MSITVIINRFPISTPGCAPASLAGPTPPSRPRLPTWNSPTMAGRFAPYLNWLDQPSVLKIHFEDLVNDRARTLNLILDHLLARIGSDTLRTPRESIIASLEASINPSRSPTFRSGKTGEWKKYFTAEHKKIFKDVAGELLVKLGYEKDDNW